MANHAILVKNQVSAKNIDALNRTVMSACAVDNGYVFQLPTENTAATTGYSQVWDVAQPATGSFTSLWMAGAPVYVETVSGNNTFRGLDTNPRNFYIPAGEVFDAFRLVKGDVVTLSVDALSGAATVGQWAYAGDATFKLNVTSTGSSVSSALALKCVQVTTIPVGSGSAVGSTYLAAYKFEVVNN